MRARRINRFAVAAAVALSVLLAGCSTQPIVEGEEPEEAVFPADFIVSEDVETVEKIGDPWQGLNKAIYRFNYRFDNYVLLPAVIGYTKITPRFLRTGVHNFYTNFYNIRTIYNSVLQFSGTKTFQTTGRLLVNSTIGLLGLFDPATAMGIPQHQEDFGQTLGKWGVGTGPYVVLPLLGPSNVRDAVGVGVDAVTMNWIREEIVPLSTEWRIVWSVLYAIDTRLHVKFLYYQTGSPWEYELVRTLYTTKRELDIEK
jgi:phospholipid-binding lipoprotein MlaA